MRIALILGIFLTILSSSAWASSWYKGDKTKNLYSVSQNTDGSYSCTVMNPAREVIGNYTVHRYFSSCMLADNFEDPNIFMILHFPDRIDPLCPPLFQGDGIDETLTSVPPPADD